ncbi:hypothetical protein K474DRAFT_1661621 [Panus rudis PR-1116 ss-1]|nr:hypothetical protein K474DRAFT_1661621 [Panus rudis PR-1116 ss-1]
MTALCLNSAAGTCKCSKGSKPVANTSCRFSLCQRCCLDAAEQARKGGIERTPCRVSKHRPKITLVAPPPAAPTAPIPPPPIVPATDIVVPLDTVATQSSINGGPSSAISVHMPSVEAHQPGPAATTVDTSYRSGYAVPIATPWQAVPPDAFALVRDRSESYDVRKRQVTEAKAAKKAADCAVTVIFWHTRGQPPSKMPVIPPGYPSLQLNKITAISAALANTPYDHTHVQVFQTHSDRHAGGESGWFVFSLDDPVRLSRGQRSCFVRAWSIRADEDLALDDEHCHGFDDCLRRLYGLLRVADGTYILSPKRSASPVELSACTKRQRVASAPPARTPERSLSPELDADGEQFMSSPGPVLHDSHFSIYRAPSRAFHSTKHRIERRAITTPSQTRPVDIRKPSLVELATNAPLDTFVVSYRPETRGNARFPSQYHFCDIYIGSRRMVEIHGRGKSYDKAFKKVFPMEGKFAQSTWGKVHRAMRSATHKECMEWVAKGRVEDARFCRFTAYIKQTPSGRSLRAKLPFEMQKRNRQGTSDPESDQDSESDAACDTLQHDRDVDQGASTLYLYCCPRRDTCFLLYQMLKVQLMITPHMTASTQSWKTTACTITTLVQKARTMSHILRVLLPPLTV